MFVGNVGSSPLSLRRRAFLLGDADTRLMGLGEVDGAGDSTTKVGGMTAVRGP